MPAYLLATVKNVKDRRGLEDYWSQARAAYAGTGARYLAAYTPFKVLEGDGPVEAIAAIEFPDMEAAMRWYESPAYRAARQCREGAADVEIILVEGGVVADPDQRVPHTKGRARAVTALRDALSASANPGTRDAGAGRG